MTLQPTLLSLLNTWPITEQQRYHLRPKVAKIGNQPRPDADFLIMASAKKNSAAASTMIADNRKARHDYQIEDDFEAGLCLEGWEVKSLRAGNANLTESYAFVKNGEAWLTGCHISPLLTASTHINPDPRRTRKLLLNRIELDRLTGAIERKGYTLVPLQLYWKRGRAKLKLGLAKGKKQHDKRADAKDRDWKMQQARILKSSKK